MPKHGQDFYIEKVLLYYCQHCSKVFFREYPAMGVKDDRRTELLDMAWKQHLFSEHGIKTDSK